MTTCPHGLAGFCPDCPPTRHTVGEAFGARSAHVRPEREDGFVVVERHREDGSYDWFTYYLTRRGAGRAAALYEATGKVKGRRP